VIVTAAPELLGKFDTATFPPSPVASVIVSQALRVAVPPTVALGMSAFDLATVKVVVVGAEATT